MRNMYKFCLGTTVLPVAPSKLTVKINGQNKTMTLINDTEISILKSPGLTDISFDCLLPQSKYSFAEYQNGFQPAEFYLNIFEQLKLQKTGFAFFVLRSRPNGEKLFSTSMMVSLEEYQIVEDAEKYGLDVCVEVKLKQRGFAQTKEMELYEEVQHNGSTVTMGVMINHRASDKSIQKTYTVQPGDALYTIAKAVYGDAEKYVDIYEANKGLIDRANDGTDETKYMIHPGQVLTIPS